MKQTLQKRRNFQRKDGLFMYREPALKWLLIPVKSMELIRDKLVQAIVKIVLVNLCVEISHVELTLPHHKVN